MCTITNQHHVLLTRRNGMTRLTVKIKPIALAVIELHLSEGIRHTELPYCMMYVVNETISTHLKINISKTVWQKLLVGT